MYVCRVLTVGPLSLLEPEIFKLSDFYISCRLAYCGLSITMCFLTRLVVHDLVSAMMMV